MLRTLLQFSSMLMILLSSIFLIKGSLVMTVENIAKSSGTYLGYNKRIIENLSQQKADYTVGISLLLLSFLLQTMNFLWPMTIDDFGAPNLEGVMVSVAITLICYVIGKSMSKCINRSLLQRAEEFMKQKILKKQ